MPGSVAAVPSAPSSVTASVLSHEARLRRQIISLRDAHTPDVRLRLARLLSNSASSRGASTVLRALQEFVQLRIAGYEGDKAGLCDVALAALDSFIAVRIRDASSKASASFHQLCQERSWTNFALFSASTVAEQALRTADITGKRLTIIDVAPGYEGRAVAKRLALCSGSSVRYGLLSNCQRLLDGVDAVVIGAEEVTMNGSILAAPGTGGVVQVAREIGVPVVVTTQAVKFSDGMIVDWTFAGCDVVRPEEVLAIVTEMEIRSSWGPGIAPWVAPDVLAELASALV